MNDKARRIYEYIVDRISHDISPTVREICSDLGIKSTSTVHRYINELCEEGLLEKRGNSNRSLQLAGDDGAARVPLIGKVTAGMPITAFECREGYVPFDCGRERVEDLFALRIQGDSMINAGILDGDVVIVRRQPVAENGEIIIAMLDGEATCKRFYKEEGHFRLQPENDNYEPIYTDEMEVLGKVIASMRYYE